MLDGPIRQLAETRFQETHNVFLIGKGTDEIVAREGSLKVKEIAYIHARGIFVELSETWTIRALGRTNSR